jgi:hypothetical protein
MGTTNIIEVMTRSGERIWKIYQGKFIRFSSNIGPSRHVPKSFRGEGGYRYVNNANNLSLTSTTLRQKKRNQEISFCGIPKHTNGGPHCAPISHFTPIPNSMEANRENGTHLRPGNLLHILRVNDDHATRRRLLI